MGFTFDDTDTKGAATPLAEMHRLVAEEPRNQDAIFPYIGGEEVNTSPTHAHHRYVINFRDFPLRREDLGELWADADEDRRRVWQRSGIVPVGYTMPVAADWPTLLAIIEEKVKPDRIVQNRKALRERWWQYAEKRLGLYSAIAGLDRVLLISRIGNAFAFTFLRNDTVYNEKTVVFPFEDFESFATLQSRIHGVWARFLSSTLKDDLQYTPSDCFETFPFPERTPRASKRSVNGSIEAANGVAISTQPPTTASRPSQPDDRPAFHDLDAVGRAYYDFRAALMLRHNEGLTKTYANSCRT